MGLIIKKTIATLIIFLVVPLITIAISWHWRPESLNNTSQILFWITETASFPWAIISSILLFLLCAVLLAFKTPKKLFLLCGILAFAVLGGQLVKTGIKSFFSEPRPYVLWMGQEFNVDDAYFYSLPKAGRKAIVHEYLNQNTTIPTWLSGHWENETGYAFPSGHTLFACTWAFLAVVLLGFRKHGFTVSVLIIWAVLMETSRLCLGMHSPADLIVGVFLAWLISLICYFSAKKCHIVE